MTIDQRKPYHMTIDQRKPCCRDPKNLSHPIHERYDLVYRRCGVCQCRHFELSVDPGKIFGKGEPAS